MLVKKYFTSGPEDAIWQGDRVDNADSKTVETQAVHPVLFLLFNFKVLGLKRLFSKDAILDFALFTQDI